MFFKLQFYQNSEYSVFGSEIFRRQQKPLNKQFVFRSIILSAAFFQKKTNLNVCFEAAKLEHFDQFASQTLAFNEHKFKKKVYY